MSLACAASSTISGRPLRRAERRFRENEADEMDIDLKQLRELMRAMKQLDVNELEIEQGDQRVFLRRGAEAAAAQPAPYAPPSPVTLPPPPAAPAGPLAEAAPEEDAGATYITSPFVGTFYRSPS